MEEVNNILSIYPLSPLQSGLLFRSNYAQNSDEYIVQSILYLDSINLNAMKSAWNNLVVQYDILRTGFTQYGSKEPIQYVLSSLKIPFFEYDWSTCSDQEILLKEFILSDRKQTFDLSIAPLMRVTLIKLHEDKFVMIWSFHHILLDGWSVAIILDELFNTYKNILNNQRNYFQHRRSYKDYIVWLRKQDTNKAILFWKRYLGDIAESTLLSFKDRIGTDDADYRSMTFHLSEDQTDNVQKFCKKHNLTLNTALIGTIGIVLQRYLNQKEVILGMTTSGRDINLVGIENMVGLFINTLPVIMPQNRDTLSYFNELQKNILLINENGYISLADIQNCSNFREKLFNVHFVFENYPVFNSLNEDNSLKIKKMDVIERVEYPLTIASYIVDNKLTFRFGFQTEHFSKTIISNLYDLFRYTLVSITENAFKNLRFLEIISPKEKQTLLIDWNLTESNYPSTKCIHELFEEQIEKNPDSIAIMFKDRQLTYRELNARSNQLARYLRKKGVTTETLVALCVERSLDMFIGILGILKAGGAYVPLDPSYPNDRLRYMLKDSNASIVLTQENVSRFMSSGVDFINLDSDCDSISNELSENLDKNMHSLNLAYVIYTSGSTGKPKGVQLNHRGAINHIFTKIKEISITRNTVVAQTAKLSFDISVWQSLAAILSGGKTLIVSDEDVLDISKLIKLIYFQEISVLELVPALFSEMLDYLEKNSSYKINNLKTLIVTGESLRSTLCKQWINLVGENKIPIINAYGPTECSDRVTHYCINSVENVQKASLVSIGKALSNLSIVILDNSLNLVPIGAVGEICVFGAGVSRGYLNHPDLTASKFVANPFGNGDRLYRTGDLGRYYSDGNIEFLGRIDNQVKVRGLRIEVGEIESVINSYENVKTSVVLAKFDEYGNKILVAYIVPNLTDVLETNYKISSQTKEQILLFADNKVEAVIDRLRNYLLLKIPEYMVPSTFVALSTIPKLPNGKVDQKLLVSIDIGKIDTKNYESPSNDTEEKLCKIWESVLNLEKVGINDNFFRIGGHSILATKIIIQIRSFFNVDLPVKSIFEHSTISALSKCIEAYNNDIKIISLVPQKRPQHIPLSFAQQRMWIIEKLLPGKPIYNIPLAIRLIGDLNCELLENSINDLIIRHESLRTTFSENASGEVYQLISSDCKVSLAIQNIDEQSIQYHIKQEAFAAFDLSKDKLIRAKLLKISDNEHVLLITVHHIISDGWSASIFLDELQKLYNSYSQGHKAVLPELPIKYTDYAIWQRGLTETETFKKQLNYWTAHLSNIPAHLNLPFDYQRSLEMSYKGDTFNFYISREICKKLAILSEKYAVSSFMILFAVANCIFQKYSNQKNIILGTPIANRHYKEIEGVLGFFANTLALNTEFGEHDRFIDVLLKVKESILLAHENQDIPFEYLVDSLNIDRHLNINPIFQAMITNNHDRYELSFNGLKSEVFTIKQIASKFDLELEIFEQNEQLQVAIIYSTELFKQETIARFSEHFCNLLDEVSSNEYQRLSEIDILSTEEKQKLLIDWNSTEADYPSTKCIHELFEEQVAQNPDAVAAVFEDKQLTYKELNARSNQLAHYLRKKGVKAETLVALCVERSLEMLIGILGILKAGGAYVPLDPSYPDDRLKYMLEDTGATILLTQEKLQDKTCKFVNIAVDSIKLDTDWNTIRTESSENSHKNTNPVNLVYVIYTSGSTGKPKGAQLNHIGAINHLFIKIKDAEITKDSVVAQTAKLSFDISVWQNLSAIVSGGKTLIIKDEDVLDVHNLLEIVFSTKVTVLELVPTLFSELLDILENRNLYKITGLEFLFITGEALKDSLCKKWITLIGEDKITIVNAYGPTECSDDVTHHFVNNFHDIGKTEIVSIGHSLGNLSVIIVDKDLNLVPIGVAGEICVFGIGVGRGYLNRPDITANIFVANPFGNGDRLYKTGDLGKYLPDGNIEFLGRIDSQVKIRGFRIELGEIESAINTHNDIKVSVVLPKTYNANDKMLVAYIVPKHTNDLKKIQTLISQTNEEISIISGPKTYALVNNVIDYILSRLPEYMIPGEFIVLDKISTLPNGKIDSNFLINLKSVKNQNYETYIPPRNELEQKICEIWRSILNLEKVGINDNFFKIGGDSIKAIQVASKMRQNNLFIAVKDLFLYQEISKLSATVSFSNSALSLASVDSLEQIVIDDDVLERHGINAENLEDSYSLSHLQEGILFHSLLSEADSYVIQSIFHLNSIDIDTLRMAWNIVASKRDILRSGVLWDEVEKNIAYVLKKVEIPLIEHDWSSAAEDKKESMLSNFINEDRQKGFDFSNPPLMRISVIKIDDNKYVMVWCFHSIFLDGWSSSIILTEVFQSYQSILNNEAVSLKNREPYRKYVEWLYTQDKQKAKQFWSDYFQGLDTVSHLSFKGAVDKCNVDYADKTYTLTANETIALRKFTKKHAITMNTVFCGAIGLILRNFLNRKDVVFGVVTSGRSIPLPHIEKMVGLFLNTLPIRVTEKNSDYIIDHLTELQTNIQTANEYGYISLSDIQNCSKVGRELFDILFIYDNYPIDDSLYNNTIKISDSYGIERIDYPLTISSYDTHKNELAFRFSYKTEYFDAAIIEKLYQHLLSILRAITKDENINIKEAFEVSLYEKQKLLVSLNATTIFNEEQQDTNRDYAPPKTDIEQKLCEIWEKALSISQVGTNDNFFKIGGNSIIAIRIISRIRSLLNVKVPLKNIFESPTIAEFSRNIKFSDYKELPPLVPQDRSGNIPLSFAQQRLWIIDKLVLKKALYNISFATRMYGCLNYLALEKAINHLVDRHESFRTNFVESKNMDVYQIISSHWSFDLKIIDIVESQIDQLATIESETPFDLERDRLIRFSVLRISDSDNVLLITMHHIISDGWSMPILLNELEILYKAYSTKTDIKLRKLPITYVDYAIWQKRWLQGEVLNNQLEYWKSHLSGSSHYLNLPFDYQRPLEMSHSGKRYNFALATHTYHSILKLSEKNNVTVFMIVFAAVNCLMHKYTNQKEIIIGTPVANRHYKETEGVIGFFANTLALKTELQSNETFLDILNKVKNAVLAGYEHQDIPFEYLVEHLNVQRHLNINPLFQVVVLALKEDNLPDFAMLQQNEIMLESPVSKFDLTFTATESLGNLNFSIEYSTELFKKETIERLAKHLCNLLDEVLSDEMLKLSDIDILSTFEKRRLLVDWNTIDVDYSSTKCIHELFEEQAVHNPDSIAAVFEGKQLTYGELNERSNQLAHYLRKKGVKTETLVALCVERSLDMLIGILGILKAGGAYVPLDPSYPEDRLKYMLEDTCATVLIIQEKLKEKVLNLAISKVELVNLDSDWYEIDKESTENPYAINNPLNLAYIIYTSGSTGKPKGVQIPHKNVTRLFYTTNENFSFNASDIWSCFHSYAFDFSVWELFGAILFGAKVVLISYEKSRYTDEFCKHICEQNVTLLSQTPSAFYQLINNSKYIDLTSLKYVVFGGEALDFSKLHFWFKYHGKSTKLINMYGITETTVHTTYFSLNEEDTKLQNIIGNKLNDLTIYILDDGMRNLPIGVYGEIYVGGSCLSRGYLNRPNLTAERFVASPFGKGERLYKTGDVARYLSDGNIEYLGRIDSQVKIRGFRIELGEIEDAINSCENIQSSVVLAKSVEHADNKQLIAYIVPLKIEALEVIKVDRELLMYVGNEVVELINNVRNKIMGTLPDYFIPSAFIVINKIPITDNGKVDSKLLLSLDTNQRVLLEEYIAPKTELEKKICKIWKDVLKIENIGIDDDFFKIGGNSLTAIRILNKISKEITSNIKVVDIFMNSTVRSLAAFVSSIKKNKSILVEFKGDHKKEALFMVHPSGYGCEVYKNLANKLKDKYWCWGIDSYNMYANVKIDILNTLAIHYISKIEEKFDLHKMQEIKFLGWSLGGQIALEMASMLEKREFSNIKILLLDTVICDDSMLNMSLNKSEIRKILQSMDTEIDDISNLIDVIFTDEKMHCQSISSKLKNTKITLLKAMQLPPLTIDKDNQLNEYILKLENNNIELCLENTDNLKVIKFNTAHHKNIIEKAQESLLIEDYFI